MTERASEPAIGRRELLIGAGGALLAAGAVAVLAPARPDAVRRYLTRHPDFLADNGDLVEAADLVTQSRALEGDRARRRALVEGKWGALLQPLAVPTLGNWGAPIRLIEFTDYLCAPCRASAPVIRDAMRGATDVQLSLMLVPISGPLADYAAAYAVAAYFAAPARFAALHEALMAEAALSPPRIDALARDAGYDPAAVRDGMAGARSRSALMGARNMSEDLSLPAVPSFLTGQGRLQLGGITPAQVRALLAAERVSLPASPSGTP